MADVKTVSPSARMVLKKNTNITIYDQKFNPDPSSHTEHVSQVLVVSTNTSQTLDQGTISTIRNVLLQSDKAVVLNFNGGTDDIDLTANGTLFMAACNLSAIKVVNESTTADDDATITYMVTD